MTRDEARRAFPRCLRRALADRSMRQVELSGLMGLRDSTVSEWCRGIRFPSMGQAAGLVEHLHVDHLATLLTAGHTVACVVCDREVVQTKRTRHPKYCSPACKATHHDRMRRESTAQVGVIAKRRLTMHQQAVAAFCHGCEPEGACRTPACALRSVSPLPLILMSPATGRAA